MKKARPILLLIFVVIIASIIVVVFEVPGRIKYSLDGMASFDEENYTISVDPIEEECSISINDSSIINENITVFETDNGLKLILNYITYNGTSYTLKVTSVGKSTYEYGEILILSDGPDKFYETDVGTVVFQKTGTDLIVDDAIVYFYSVYPENEISAADMAKLDINLIIDDMTIRSYQKN